MKQLNPAIANADEKVCRSCGGKLRLVLSLGNMPIVNTFPLAEELGKEKKLPLRLCICRDCRLVQLSPIIPKTDLFDQYHYVSGASSPLIRHLERLAGEIEVYLSKKKGKVLDIGCNDGTLLRVLQQKGFAVLGIDPAATVVQLARAKGLPVICDFFTKESAGRIRREHGSFDVVVITHTLANIVDLRGFFAGVKEILSLKGTVVIEVGSLEVMLERGQFDAIYHEHYSYFSAESLVTILEKNGFFVFRLETNEFHGGALRVFARKKLGNEKSTVAFRRISNEEYGKFSKGVREYKKRMQKLFVSIRGKRIVGFGAPAKGVTLLNYCGIGKKDLIYIVDTTPYKQGRFLPGVKVPVFAEEFLWQDIPPEYILLLSWNYKDAILAKLKKHLGKKIKVILPFPAPSFLQPE